MALFASAAYKLTFARNASRWLLRGYHCAQRLNGTTTIAGPYSEPQNDLQKYFDSLREGPGIFKWRHYFETYSRHFEKFRGKSIRLLEIGVYSGGGLSMWRDYFGPQCEIYGIDIKPECRAYEQTGIRIFIGDQADRGFWGRFKAEVNELDIIIDDGGHAVEQQAVTLEELWPILRPGGAYLCEDIHAVANPFSHYISGLSWNLNNGDLQWSDSDNERTIAATATPFQSAVHSIHLYPFVAVIEKRMTRLTEFVAPKHGSEWQPPSFWERT